MNTDDIANFWRDEPLWMRNGVNVRLPVDFDDVAIITYDATPTTPAHISVVAMDGRIIDDWEVDDRSWVPPEPYIRNEFSFEDRLHLKEWIYSEGGQEVDPLEAQMSLNELFTGEE